MSNGCRAQQEKSQASQAAHHSEAAKVVMMQHSRSKNTRGVPHQPKGQRQQPPPADSSPGRLNLRPRTPQEPCGDQWCDQSVPPVIRLLDGPLPLTKEEIPKIGNQGHTRNPTIARSPRFEEAASVWAGWGFMKGWPSNYSRYAEPSAIVSGESSPFRTLQCRFSPQNRQTGAHQRRHFRSSDPNEG